jgi:choline-glycine betaine transporter
MKIRRAVFGIPVILLTLTIVFSLLDGDKFLAITKNVNDWILTHFGWLFASTAILGLILLLIVYFSPIGSLIIGGKNAKPILNKLSWFSISLCTTIAVGILFWATAEPLYHFNQPPEGLEINSRSDAARTFSISTLFLHWTFIPYSIYTLTALMFAISYYNLKQPFQIGSLLVPILGEKKSLKLSPYVDSISLFSLVAGMSASMGAGLLTLSGGIKQFIPEAKTETNIGFIAFFLTLTFIWSASSGLQKGIKLLSNINIVGFILLLGWFIFFGPFNEIWPYFGSYIFDFVSTIIPRSLAIGIDKSWANSWTIFYWANWLAWTPISALFLGRLGKGYNVRTFIRFNLLFPSLFSMLWMALFGSYSLYFDQIFDGALNNLLQQKGPESIIFELIKQLPLSTLWIIFYFFLVFISFVTAADSNTSAMSGLSTEGISETKEEAPYLIKIIWGSIIGLTAWIMVSKAGIEGVKMTSNLGGFPSLFIYIFVIISTFRMLIQGRNSPVLKENLKNE